MSKPKTIKQVLRQASRKCPLEHDECLDLVQWLRERMIVFVHIPNEGLRSVIEGRKLRAIGLHRGFPDYLIFRPEGKAGTALEMKRIKGSDPPKNEQLEWGVRMTMLGWDFVVGQGAEDAIKQLKELGYG